MTTKSRKEQADIAARELLERLEIDHTEASNGTYALFKWQGILLLGRVRRLYPEKPYIVYITKDSEPISPDMAAAIRRTYPMPLLKVAPKVEFNGRNYLLGISGEMVCVLSGEDIMYCLVHPRQPAGEKYEVGADTTFDNP